MVGPHSRMLNRKCDLGRGKNSEEKGTSERKKTGPGGKPATMGRGGGAKTNRMLSDRWDKIHREEKKRRPRGAPKGVSWR